MDRNTTDSGALRPWNRPDCLLWLPVTIRTMPQLRSGPSRLLKLTLLLFIGLTLLAACGETPGDPAPRAQVTFLHSVQELTVGESFRFTAVAQTADGLSSEITWSSGDAGIATVDQTGLVTGVAAGITTITASSLLEPAASAELPLTVTAAQPDPEDPEEPAEPVDPEDPVDPVNPEPRMHYLEPADFNGDRLRFELPASETGRTVLIVSPDLDTTDYARRNDYIHDQHYDFTITTSPGGAGSGAALKPMPEPPGLKVSDWSMPAAVVNPPPASYQFSIWSPADGSYVTVPGVLAHESDHLAFYEDPANIINFTRTEYETISSLVGDNFAELTRLMGEPTDLDGNGKIKVFISSTMMDLRAFGEAYVDGCHMFLATPTGCSGPGEFIYVAALDHFGIGPHDARDFFVTDYYPGNILHEAVHLLQMAHSHRRFGSYRHYNAPAFLSEGQAELIKFLSGISASRNWQRVADNLTYPQPERQNPWFQPYDLGGPLMLFLHEYGGEGFSQAFIERMYDADLWDRSLLEPIFGVPEPLLYASLYGALLFDGTLTGQQTGLQFNDFDLGRELAGARPPVARLMEAGSSSAERTFSGAAIFEITHQESVWIELESLPETAYVLVVPTAE